MTRNLKEFVNQHVDVRSVFDIYGPDHVAILLAHYNGAAMLGEQLQSLSAQTHRDWSLILSDDGSSDAWMDIATDFTKSEPGRRIWLTNGPRRGFAQNFASLIALAGPSVPYAAFCDQDDVWCPAKLETAIAALKTVSPGQPALYCGRTMVVDQNLQPLHMSPYFARPPDFRNALVQNIGGGNTMVLNRAALDLLQDTIHHTDGIVSHDWWTYQLVSGAGGEVIYDPEPHVLYRQHAGNLVGANGGWRARVARLLRLLKGEFRAWNTANTAALEKSKHWLTPEARDTLAQFSKARQGRLGVRLASLSRSGAYRQTRQGQCALWLAAWLRKL